MSQPQSPPSKSPVSSLGVLAALAVLYAAQGIPFGFATEYLPVVLRAEGFTRTQIAGMGFLQLPWQFKPLWAGIADHPRVRPHARRVLLALQLVLALTVAAYALFGGRDALAPWFALTVLAAFLAATQDIFVDAFAVRTLRDKDRGHGNSAQIGGYRIGMILGGGGMLVLSARFGTARTVLLCALAIALAAFGAFALRADAVPHEADEGPYRTASPATTEARSPLGLGALWGVLRALFSRDTWAVATLALTYKLGTHAASALVKPMLVDHHWHEADIGWAVVTLGTGAAVLGSLVGGFVHRSLGEARALGATAVLQSVAVLPLLVAASRGATHTLTAAAIAADHFASGVGSTVLFAALMTATSRERAALQYTVLTSLNAMAIGLGALLGSGLGDLGGERFAFGVAAVLCLGPLTLVPRWSEHARASATSP